MMKIKSVIVLVIVVALVFGIGGYAIGSNAGRYLRAVSADRCPWMTEEGFFLGNTEKNREIPAFYSLTKDV